MSDFETFVLYSILTGSGATLVMDTWALARSRLLGIASLDYALVGRWLIGLTQGQFVHSPISASPARRGEGVIGWTAHYAIGIAFAAILLAIWGVQWAAQPTLAPALIIGLGSVAAPFLIMQPGMGAGVAASRTPNPTKARLRSLTTHGIFGLGLYLSAWAIAGFIG